MIAGLIGLGFAWLWLLVGSSAAAGAGLPIAIAGSALIAFTARRVVHRRRARTGTFIPKYYIAAVVGEVIAIVAAQSWLASHRLEALLFSVIGVIVGLHLWAAVVESPHVGLRLWEWLAIAATMLAACACLWDVAAKDAIAERIVGKPETRS